MNVLVTGAAGFIGMHVCSRLISDGLSVRGLDNMSAYYDVKLKRERLNELEKVSAAHPKSSWQFHQIDVAHKEPMVALFDEGKFDVVIHLAAQAGVRYSLEAPETYVESNLTGFGHMLECCRHHQVSHLLYASSSSVYGKNTKQPFSEDDVASHPVSLYAASKRANELMAHSYSHLFELPTTGLRFFTVYGPWGRPDMALFKFVDAIEQGNAIDVFNHGNMSRDFTYVDDVVEGIARLMDKVPTASETFSTDAPTASTSDVPYRIFNIGSQRPTSVLDFISSVEVALGKTADKNMLPMQPGDVASTFADVSALRAVTGFTPQVLLDDGVKNFVDWFQGWRQSRDAR